MTDRPSTPGAHEPGKNRSSTPISEAFKDFISTRWSDNALATPQLSRVATACAKRRDSLGAHFRGITVVVPAGTPKQRSNDTDYPYRPHTAFAYLTGWGSASVPGSVLVGTPSAAGHEWVLFTRPPAPRTSDEFYANAAVGEFWTGRRPDLAHVTALLGLATQDVQHFPSADTLGASPLALIAEADPSLARELEPTPHHDDAANELLAQVISEMRLVKDSFEIEQLTAAIEATHRGFDDIVHSVSEAIGHERGERVVEGVFGKRARIEGNATGYDTIAASGPHACILHWVRNDGPVHAGDLLLVDAGIEMDSLYTADITRTLPVSGTFSPDQRMIYEAVLEAADAAFAVVKPGALFRHVHEAAMAVIATKAHEWGLLPVPLEQSLAPEGSHHRRYMIHGTSHHLGLDVHDCAQARREMYMDKELEEGMVFTIEPGLYFQPDDETVPKPWRGIGVRIEDNIVVTREGGINLSAAIPRTVAEVEKWLAR